MQPENFTSPFQDAKLFNFSIDCSIARTKLLQVILLSTILSDTGQLMFNFFLVFY